MFCVEFILSRTSIQIYINKDLPKIGILERLMGIVLWPIFLGIFLYNFFKQLLK
jgi:hypothetical protein